MVVWLLEMAVIFFALLALALAATAFREFFDQEKEQ